MSSTHIGFIADPAPLDAGKANDLLTFDRAARPEDSPFVSAVYTLIGLQNMVTMSKFAEEDLAVLRRPQTLTLLLQAMHQLCYAAVKSPPKALGIPWSRMQHSVLATISSLMHCVFTGFRFVLRSLQLHIEQPMPPPSFPELERLDNILELWEEVRSQGRRKRLPAFMEPRMEYVLAPTSYA